MSASTRNRLRKHKLQKQQQQQQQQHQQQPNQSKPLHFSPPSNIISYKWPEIYVPHTSFTRYIVEKFLFYSNQIFLIDGQSGSQFTYRHILVDSLKTARILRANHVTAASTVAIIGGNCYEHVCTFFAAMLLDAKVVLVESTASKEQIMAVVRTCGISYLAVIKPKQQRQGTKKEGHSFSAACTAQLTTLVQQCRNPYLMAFGDDDGKEEDDAESILLEGIRRYTVFEENPINSKYLGLQRKANSENRWNRTRVIIPKFRGSKVLKCYHINEYSLMSQLTYATLPQSGFEWNINDVILNMWPLCRLLGIFELLVTFSVGARIVLHRHDDSRRYGRCGSGDNCGGRQRMEVEELSDLVARHGITAAVLHSSYLLDLVKWSSSNGGKDQLSLCSLEKVLYTEQPIHRNIVSAFRKKYNITNCRYGYFLHEASGFAAIEVINYANSSAVSVTPLPNMEIVVVNRTTGALNGHGQLGKIFIRSPYCAAVVTSSTSPLTKPKQPKTADDWLFSGFIGYYDNSTYLQVIDHYSNFSKSGHIFISKTLVETVLLSHPAVARAVAMKNATQKTSNEFQAFVTLKESDQQQFSEEALGTYLNSYLNDNRMVWSVAIVQRLPRSSASHQIITRRLKTVQN